MKTARVALRLHEDLVSQIDAARGDVSRTRWIERALESALRSAGDATFSGTPGLPAPDSARTRASAARARVLQGPPLPLSSPAYEEWTTATGEGSPFVALECPKATCHYSGPEAKCPDHKLTLKPIRPS